jgi:acyl-CoA reductase-like NAD-dependent aldehyde dehydrogenase
MKIMEINCKTGEEIIREATKAEKDDAKARKEKIEAEQTEAETKAAARQAILDRLGLTADEAKLLLG